MVAMMRIQCETSAFDGSGNFICEPCQVGLHFARGCAVVITMLPHATVVLHATTGTVLHNCLHVRSWEINEPTEEYIGFRL